MLETIVEESGDENEPVPVDNSPLNTASFEESPVIEFELKE